MPIQEFNYQGKTGAHALCFSCEPRLDGEAHLIAPLTLDPTAIIYVRELAQQHQNTFPLHDIVVFNYNDTQSDKLKGPPIS